MTIALRHIIVNAGSQKLIEALYQQYSLRLLSYTRKNYKIPEDDAVSLVYKTIYRMVEVNDRYSFAGEQKRGAFVFKTYINYLRNYFRDDRSFEKQHLEVGLVDYPAKEETTTDDNPKLRLLNELLDRMQDWERMLLLMRGQGMSYGEIARFVQKPEKHLEVYYGRLKTKLMNDMNELMKKSNDEK